MSSKAPKAREYFVPDNVAKKWTPLTDQTRNYVHNLTRNAFNLVLGANERSQARTEIQEHLQKLEAKITKRLAECVAPAAPKRRKLDHSTLLTSIKGQEEALVACQQQIVCLESELAKETACAAEDQAHLESYVDRMKDAAAHSKKSKLHPLLRESAAGGTLDLNYDMLLDFERGDDLSADTSSTEAPGHVTGDQDLERVRSDLTVACGKVQHSAANLQQWLSAVHTVAEKAAVANSAEDPAAA